MMVLRTFVWFVLIQSIFCDISMNNEGKASMQGQGADSNTPQSGQSPEDSGIVPEHFNEVQSQNVIKDVNAQEQVNPASDPVSKSDTSQPGFKSQVDTINNKGQESLNYDDSELKQSADETRYVSLDTNMFEETGDKDESLVEQMNRLSEKIRKSQDKKLVEEMMVASSNDEIYENVNSKTDGTSESEQMSSKINADHFSSSLHIKTDVKRVNEHDSKRESNPDRPKEGIYTDPENIQMQQREVLLPGSQGGKNQIKKTVTEQMHELVNDINNGQMFVPTIHQADDEPGTFPDDADLNKDHDINDINLNTKVQKHNSDVGIQNTDPPKSDIQPTRTSDPEQMLSSSKPYEQVHVTGRVDVGATPTLDDLKKTFSDAVTTTKHDNKIQPTTDTPVYVTKEAYDGQTKKQMRLDKQRKLSAKSALKETATEMNFLHQGKDEQSLESQVYNLHLSATPLAVPASQTVEIPQSQEKASGTIYETRIETQPETNLKDNLERQLQNDVMPSSTFEQGKVTRMRAKCTNVITLGFTALALSAVL